MFSDPDRYRIEQHKRRHGACYDAFIRGCPGFSVARGREFWSEFKRRKVHRAVIAYAIVAWVAVEVSSVVLPQLLLPDWTVRLIVVLALLGLPITMVLAWTLAWTPAGLQRERPAEATPQLTATAGAGEPEATFPVDDSRRSIVVLPFANLSDQANDAWFSDGITEEILSLLAKQPDLRVVSRTTSFSLRDSALDMRSIARKLGVEMVLEGSVRRAGKLVRITAQLIDPAADAHVWNERYDRELTDIFAVQGEIARRIVDALQLDPDCCPEPRPPTGEIEAYDYYLRGRQYFYAVTEDALQYARQMFLQAIQRDPGFARAHAALANTASFTAQWFSHSPELLAEADRASRLALELDPNLAETHSARGFALTLNGDFSGAAREFERALEIEPENYDTLYLFGRSRYAEGRMTEAAELFRRAHEAQPDEFQAAALREGALFASGDSSQRDEALRVAIGAVQRRLELNPDDQRAMQLGCGLLIADGQKAAGLAMARRLLAVAPTEPGALYNALCAFARAGEHDEALRLLERRVAMGGIYRDWLENDPDLAGLRDNPRFQELVQRIRPRILPQPRSVPGS